MFSFLFGKLDGRKKKAESNDLIERAE